MRARRILAAVLACAPAAAIPAPAAAQTAPWEPATDLFSHMTGDAEDGGQLDDAIRSMVDDSVDFGFDQAARSMPGAGDGTSGEWTSGERPPGDGGGPAERSDAPGTVGGGAEGSAERADAEHAGGGVRFESHPVSAHAQRIPCEEAGGTLVEVSEHAGAEVRALGVACVPPEHAAAADEHALTRRLASQHLHALDLPGGTVAAAPAEGLAWLPSRLTLTGEAGCPAELRLPAGPGARRPLGERTSEEHTGQRTLQVTCTTLAREWLFGDGATTRTAGTVTSVEHTYRQGGHYQVTVRTVRRARALLDGQPLAEETLISWTTFRYPVAELRAVLTR